MNIRSSYQGFLKHFKGFYAIIIKNKWNIFLEKISKRPNFLEISLINLL